MITKTKPATAEKNPYALINSLYVGDPAGTLRQELHEVERLVGDAEAAVKAAHKARDFVLGKIRRIHASSAKLTLGQLGKLAGEKATDAAMRSLLKRVKQGWEKYRRHGATDQQILLALKVGWPRYAGYQANRAEGGDAPKAWIGQEYGYGAKPTFEGKPLIAEVRRLLEIPQPKAPAAKPAAGGHPPHIALAAARQAAGRSTAHGKKSPPKKKPAKKKGGASGGGSASTTATTTKGPAAAEDADRDEVALISDEALKGAETVVVPVPQQKPGSGAVSIAFRVWREAAGDWRAALAVSSCGTWRTEYRDHKPTEHCTSRDNALYLAAGNALKWIERLPGDQPAVEVAWCAVDDWRGTLDFNPRPSPDEAEETVNVAVVGPKPRNEMSVTVKPDGARWIGSWACTIRAAKSQSGVSGRMWGPPQDARSAAVREAAERMLVWLSASIHKPELRDSLGRARTDLRTFIDHNPACRVTPAPGTSFDVKRAGKVARDRFAAGDDQAVSKGYLAGRLPPLAPVAGWARVCDVGPKLWGELAKWIDAHPQLVKPDAAQPPGHWTVEAGNNIGRLHFSQKPDSQSMDLTAIAIGNTGYVGSTMRTADVARIIRAVLKLRGTPGDAAVTIAATNSDDARAATAGPGEPRVPDRHGKPPSHVAGDDVTRAELQELGYRPQTFGQWMATFRGSIGDDVAFDPADARLRRYFDDEVRPSDAARDFRAHLAAAAAHHKGLKADKAAAAAVVIPTPREAGQKQTFGQWVSSVRASLNGRGSDVDISIDSARVDAEVVGYYRAGFAASKAAGLLIAAPTIPAAPAPPSLPAAAGGPGQTYTRWVGNVKGNTSSPALLPYIDPADPRLRELYDQQVRPSEAARRLGDHFQSLKAAAGRKPNGAGHAERAPFSVGFTNHAGAAIPAGGAVH